MRTEVFIPEVLGTERELDPEFQETCSRLIQKQHILYSPEMGERILALYANGATLGQIAKFRGMPTYQTILRWCRDDTKFAREFENARMARSLFYEDEIGKIALGDVCAKDDAPGVGHKLSALFKLAEWGDPARFGKKVTVAGDEKRPVVFRVVTGVPDNPYQQPPELNKDGTQKRDILIQGSSSEAEHHSDEIRGEVAGSNPASPNEPTPAA